MDYRAGNIYFDAYLSGDNILSGTISLVPEPLSEVLFVGGGAVLGFRCFRRKRKKA